MTVGELASTSGEESIDDLEKRKLRLELINLAKPWWRRPQSIVALIGLFAAIGGWILTSHNANIESKLEVLGLNEKIEKHRSSISNIQTELDQIKQEKTALEKEKKALLAGIKILKDQESSLISSLKEDRETDLGSENSRMVSGYVVDTLTGTRVQNAVVELRLPGRGDRFGVFRTQSDSEGRFSVLIPVDEEVVLLARQVGYQSIQLLVGSDNNSTLMIGLQPQGILEE